MDGDGQSQSPPAGGTTRRDALLSAAANRRMFGAIARRYDRLNRVLSLGLDVRWRRLAVQALGMVPGGRYLDVGTGTADLVIEGLRQAPAVRFVGIDPAVPMLREGGAKLGIGGLGEGAALVAADGLRLPFRNSSFDGACSAFVVRNVVDRERLFRELHRVLRTGAYLVLLELTRPRHPLLRLGHGFFLRAVVPGLGGVLSRGSAYRYLAESIRQFPEPVEVLGEMAAAGFGGGWAQPLTGGVVTLMVGRRVA